MGGKFTAEVGVRIDEETLFIEANLTLENPELEELIDEGLARFSVVVTCRQTYSRRPVLGANKIRVRLPASEFRGLIEIEPSILAVVEIPDFRPSNLNEDYGATTFSVFPGDALAIADRLCVNLDPDFDPLRAPIGSIMRITHREEATGPMLVRYDADQIVIELSRSAWSSYQQSKLAGAAEFLHAAIVLPVLVEAIQKARDSDESIGRWSVRLLEILAMREISAGETPLYSAQAVLREPVGRALETIVGITSSADGAEE